MKLVDNFVSCKEPLQILPSMGHAVAGVATLGNTLFVLRNRVKHVDVDDVETLTIQRQLPLPVQATGENRSLVACPVNRFIYASDWKGNYVHKLGADSAVFLASSWPVGKYPMGLSLTVDRNILVACNDASAPKIQEYTPLGVLVREIITPPIKRKVNMRLAHAVQLPNGQYGVSDGEERSNRFYVLDASGLLVDSHPNSARSDHVQLNYPWGLALSKRGFVFIACDKGNTVFVLDPTSSAITPLSVEGVIDPYCVHIDHARGRLYIGEWNAGRVIVLGQTG